MVKAENKPIARSLNSMSCIPKKHNQLGESIFLTVLLHKLADNSRPPTLILVPAFPLFFICRLYASEGEVGAGYQLPVFDRLYAVLLLDVE